MPQNNTPSLYHWYIEASRKDERMNLDRFSQGLPDPQDADVLAYCDCCGKEIYEGEEVYTVYDAVIHAEDECLFGYFGIEKMTIEEALGVEK